jgi:hypothetical protein
MRLPDPVIGDICVGAFGTSKADALEKAALVAERISSDPVMMAIMPPWVTAAVLAAKLLGRAAKIGMPELRAMAGTLKKPSQRRLAAALAKEAAQSEADNGDDSEPVEVGARRPKTAAAPALPPSTARVTDHRNPNRIVTTDDGRTGARHTFTHHQSGPNKGLRNAAAYASWNQAKTFLPAEFQAHERSKEVTAPDYMPPDPYGQQQPYDPFNPYGQQQPQQPYGYGFPPSQPYNPFAPPGYQPMTGPGGVPVSPFTPGYQPWNPYAAAVQPYAPPQQYWADPMAYNYGPDNGQTGIDYEFGADYGYGYDGGYGYQYDGGEIDAYGVEVESADNGGEYDGGEPAEVRDHRKGR